MVLNRNRIKLYVGLIVFSLFIVAGNVYAQGPSGSGSSVGGDYSNEKLYRLNEAGLLSKPQWQTDVDIWPDEDRKPLWLAQAEKENGDEEKPLSSECEAFAKDPDADVGDIIRAGCQPTTGQMSALMDNPLGNVAMLFTQVDVLVLENPTNNKDANKVNYMGIAQFPKGLGENWNLINRIVWNVPSMPLDQGKIDRATALGRVRDQYASGPGGSTLPPSDSPIAPSDSVSIVRFSSARCR